MKNILRPNQVRTLIFMDFETTGLIPPGIEDNRPVPGDTKRSINNFVTKCIKIHDTVDSLPQITEMCFLSVPRQNFDKEIQNLHNEAGFGNDTKLISNIASNFYSCQVRPNLHPNDWIKYEETRKITAAIHLSQDDLKFKNSFKKEWPIVHKFLENQEKPACLIAHNGMKFDFRILYGELARNKLIQEYPIPDGIYFLDSYLAFLDLEKSHLDKLATVTTGIDWEKVSDIFESAKLTNQPTEEITEPGPSSVQNDDEIQIIGNEVISESIQILDSESALSQPLTVGFVTPPKKKTENKKENSATKRGYRLFQDDDVLPLAFMDTGKWSPAKRRRTGKSFFRKVSESKWEFNKFEANTYFFKGNFKLENLFKQVTKSDYNAHHAHADCEALLQVCLAYGDEFGSYMDNKKEEIPILQNKERNGP